MGQGPLPFLLFQLSYLNLLREGLQVHATVLSFPSPFYIPPSSVLGDSLGLQGGTALWAAASLSLDCQLLNNDMETWRLI